MSGNMIPIAGEPKKRICYFFDSDIGNYHYGPGHPMKPHRIRMTHALVMNYGLYKKMEIFRAKPATRKEMAQFHTDDYVEFLSKVTPDNMDEYLKEQAKFNLGDDCPVFDGLFEYCSISAGGSMEGAARLSRDKCDIAINWAGGLHHAKKAEANGFCYVNDIVLGILELLRYHKRVLYVDIDVHHGDGVEEAFYTTDRVMTCSFHKYGEFFPGTGELRDTGHGKGKYYAVNFPLRDGITDEAYKNIFEPVIMKIMETYQPSAIVLQCGGDSLSGDRLGSFNVSMRGHANCVRFIKSLGLPLLLLGGGGYTIRNVSRTWAYETGLAAGQELCPDIPMNEYYEYYGPTYRLDVPPSNMEDMNIVKYLEKTKIQIFENLRHTIPVPSVGLQAIPRLPHDEMDVDEDLDDPNERKPQRLLDALIQRDDEFSDSEDEAEGGRRDIQSHKRMRRQSPKLNGNGIISNAGSHGSLDQSRNPYELNHNHIPQSQPSSRLSSGTTSMADATLPHQGEASNKNLIENLQAQNQVEGQSDGKEILPASAPALEDVPMLSQADRIELEKLASEALATSPTIESVTIQNPENFSQPRPMEIDEKIPAEPVSDRSSGNLVVEKNQIETSKPDAPPVSNAHSAPLQAQLPQESALNSTTESSQSPFPQEAKSSERSHQFPLVKSESGFTGIPEQKEIFPEIASAAHDPMEITQTSSTKSADDTSQTIVIEGQSTSTRAQATQVDCAPHPLEASIKSEGSSEPTAGSIVVGSQVSKLDPSSSKPPQAEDSPSALNLSAYAPGQSNLASTSSTVQEASMTSVETSGHGLSTSMTTTWQPTADQAALEGVTDEFVSEVAQAIAEGEAGAASQTNIISSTTSPGPVQTEVSKGPSHMMDPQLNSISTSAQQSSASSSSSPSTHPAKNPDECREEKHKSTEVEGSAKPEETYTNIQPLQARDESHTSPQSSSSTHPAPHLHSSIDPLITNSVPPAFQPPSNLPMDSPTGQDHLDQNKPSG